MADQTNDGRPYGPVLMTPDVATVFVNHPFPVRRAASQLIPRWLLVAISGLAGASMTPAMAQGTQLTPYFRVPMGASPTSATVEPTYAWLETLGACSTTCGTGTRTTEYQCQNVADSDYAGTGYGLPEAEASCTASSGAKPPSMTSACTLYTGCGYDWVKPPVVQTAIAYGANPVGRIGCGLVNTKYQPYCQRTGGGTNVVLSASDHRFCASDRPDYDDVAAGSADALGYDRNGAQETSCLPTDHDWISGAWGSWTSDCSTTASRTRAVTCTRRWNAEAKADAECGSGTRPEAAETVARYGSCSYSYSYGAWSAWSSDCDADATRTRSESCVRSNDGGQTVPLAECTSRSVAGRQSASEAGARYGSCSYAYRTGGWSAWSSGCDSGATRSRSISCERSNNGGQSVDEAECASRGLARPALSETSARYDSCAYSFATGQWGTWSSGCSAAATRTRAVTCMRANNGGTAVADAECTSRGIAQPDQSETGGEYGSCSYAAGGVVSGWSAWASGCSGSTTRTRRYQCVRSNDGGQIVADGECTGRGVGLVETQSGAKYASCTHSWQTGAWGSFNSGCSSAATRSRSVWCARDLDGAVASDASCAAGLRPAASETVGEFGSCSYAAGSPGAWSDWASGCSGSTTRTRRYQCQRSNDGGQIVGDAECTGRGIGLVETQSGANYASCTHAWQTGGWGSWSSGCSAAATRSRSVWCARSSDGVAVSDSNCDAGDRPSSSETLAQYGSCTFARGGEFAASAWSSGCSGSAQRTHYFACVRSDGAGVDASECTSRGVSVSSVETAANYAGCSYAWKSDGWGSWSSSCSAEASRTRSVYCVRSDGTTVADADCGGGRPSSSESTAIYSGCTYSPGYGSWSACPQGANQSQSRTMASCTRSDGVSVGIRSCTDAGYPDAQTQGCDWNPSGYGHGYVLATYAFSSCTSIDTYPNGGSTTGVDPAQCRTGQATYARKCSNGGNADNNASCDYLPSQTNPRGPSGYPCDVICR